MSQLIHEAFQELKSLKEATFSFDKSGNPDILSFAHSHGYGRAVSAGARPIAEAALWIRPSF